MTEKLEQAIIKSKFLRYVYIEKQRNIHIMKSNFLYKLV